MKSIKKKIQAASKSMNNNRKNDISITQLLISDDCAECFHSLAEALNFEFNVYNGEGTLLFSTRENPFCSFIRSSEQDDLRCPASCSQSIFESMEPNETVIFKCSAELTCFAFALENLGEKAFVVGKGGFALYDDLLKFLKIAKERKLQGIPVSMPLDFPGEEYIKTVSRYVYLSINRLLNSFEEKYKLEEKILRMTSLFDSHIFGTLARNPGLIHRYILDTVEFVFGRTSSALLLLEKDSASYRTAYSAGKYGGNVKDFQFDKESHLIKEMIETGAPVFTEDLEKVDAEGLLKEIKFSYFFPLFMSGVMEGIIWVLDRKFSREDMKIMNAFRDYIQVNLENQNLRVAMGRVKKADETLNSFVDFSKSIASVLDKEKLLHTILEKSLELLKAEQGSLMLVDSETSELVVEARKTVDDAVKEKMRLKKGEGVAGIVLESGGSLLVEDIESDPRVSQQSRAHYKTKSFVSVPIKVEGRVTGVLNATDKIEGNIFNKDDLELIQSFMNNMAIAIERSILFKRTEEYKRLSITDPLTGIYNRRYLNSRLSEEITRYNRYKHPFSFLMFDLDGFKEYNDTYGHISGDKLLKALAGIIEESLRTIDIAARFGGDEFVSIFPQTPKVDAIQITNRVKEKIDKFLSEYNPELNLSVSMGLATYPDDASSIMELIEKTDQALYLAKKGGGNRVVYL
jgi:diguanylate cyclase (GGDEF)-like protein